MTTSTETTADLLRAARENAEFREAFRREILTDELLELPQRFAEHVAATNDRLSRIEALVAENTKNIAALTESMNAANRRLDNLEALVAENSKNIAELTESMKTVNRRLDNLEALVAENSKNIAELVENTKAMNRRLDGIDMDIKSLHGMYSQQHEDFHRFRGAYAENAARKDDGMIASKISRERGNRVRIIKRLSHDDMYAIFDEAIERDLLDGIDDESQDRFANADDTLLVTERGRAQSQFYVVIEASHTAHRRDLTRVANHAKVIERVKGIPAFGVVAGVRIGQDLPMELLLDPATLVRNKNPNAALWHLLNTSDMDPMTG